MIATFAGNWLGGQLPTWLGQEIGPTGASSSAYAFSLLVVAALLALAIVPLLLLRRREFRERTGREVSPFAYTRRHPVLLGKLVGPMFITSLGAGLLMPFMNVFFRHVHGSADSTIGTLFATGSLAMAIGLLLAPPLADRFGKIQIVVLSQAFSVPFLALLGFAPWFWVSAFAYLVRLALMNMANPVYQAFVMEHVEEESRATVASLVSMSWSFGWAFSPTVSGWLQVNYGFNPVFLGTIGSYIFAIYLYWRFFWSTPENSRVGQSALEKV